MGVDLVNDKGSDFHLNWTGWNAVYQMALVNRWVPLGTRPPAGWEDPERRDGGEPRPWDGDYGTNDGQYVTPEDALAMAEALEKAIDPEWLETVKEFIAFAKEGGFCIY
jgi:hypothetical protein